LQELGLSTSGARTDPPRIFWITSGVRYFAHAPPPPDENSVPVVDVEPEVWAGACAAAASDPLFEQAATDMSINERQSCAERDI
jgi:hypothetical protein